MITRFRNNKAMWIQLAISTKSPTTIRSITNYRNYKSYYNQISVNIKMNKLLYTTTARVNHNIQKLKMEDTWKDFYLVSKKSIHFLDGNTNEKFINNASIFLGIANMISRAKEDEHIIQEIFEEDISRCHYPFSGPVANAMYNWANIIKKMDNDKQFDDINLHNPVTTKEIAITNLFLLAKKVIVGVYKLETDTTMWPLNPKS